MRTRQAASAVAGTPPSTGTAPPVECEVVPLVDQAATLIQLVARELRRDDDTRFRDAPLTAAQLGVAAVLAQRGSLRVGELAGAACCVPANITAIVDRLERKGFASRSQGAEDRRVITVSLTRAGMDAVAQTTRRSAAASRIGDALDDGRLSELVALLGPLYLSLAKHGELES